MGRHKNERKLKRNVDIEFLARVNFYSEHRLQQEKTNVVADALFGF